MSGSSTSQALLCDVWWGAQILLPLRKAQGLSVHIQKTDRFASLSILILTVLRSSLRDLSLCPCMPTGSVSIKMCNLWLPTTKTAT